MDSAIHTIQARPPPEVEDPHAARKPPRCSRQIATFWPGGYSSYIPFETGRRTGTLAGYPNHQIVLILRCEKQPSAPWNSWINLVGYEPFFHFNLQQHIMCYIIANTMKVLTLTHCACSLTTIAQPRAAQSSSHPPVSLLLKDFAMASVGEIDEDKPWDLQTLVTFSNKQPSSVPCLGNSSVRSTPIRLHNDLLFGFVPINMGRHNIVTKFHGTNCGMIYEVILRILYYNKYYGCILYLT